MDRAETSTAVYLVVLLTKKNSFAVQQDLSLEYSNKDNGFNLPKIISIALQLSLCKVSKKS